MDKNKELSEISIGQDGFETVTADFAVSGKSRQKETILNALQDHHHGIIRLNDEIRNLEHKQKQVQSVLRNSAEYMEVQDLKREIKESRQHINALLMESQGMLKLSKKLGIDIKPQSIRQIQQGAE